MAARPPYLGTLKSIAAQILPADTTTKITIFTPGANGSRVYAIGAASTDGTTRDINVYVTKGGVDYLLATINIPVNAGNTNAIPSVDLLSSAMLPWVRLDEAGRKYLDLETGSVLKFACTTTVTAAKALQFFGHGGDV